MKRKTILVSSVAAILLAGLFVWYTLPVDLMDLDHKEVLEIVVFNGSSGNEPKITDKEKIKHISHDLSDVEIKSTRHSMGYNENGYKLSVYLSDGNEAGDWNNFIINSEDTIRKDPFFYSVIKGYIDYNYIENIAELYINLPIIRKSGR